MFGAQVGKLKAAGVPEHVLVSLKAELGRGGFRRDVPGCLLLGLRHGAYCVGCCWALMALLFVGGVMNLFWIVLLSLLVFVEKVFSPTMSRSIRCRPNTATPSWCCHTCRNGLRPPKSSRMSWRSWTWSSNASTCQNMIRREQYAMSYHCKIASRACCSTLIWSAPSSFFSSAADQSIGSNPVPLAARALHVAEQLLTYFFCRAGRCSQSGRPSP